MNWAQTGLRAWLPRRNSTGGKPYGGFFGKAVPRNYGETAWGRDGWTSEWDLPDHWRALGCMQRSPGTHTESRMSTQYTHTHTDFLFCFRTQGRVGSYGMIKSKCFRGQHRWTQSLVVKSEVHLHKGLTVWKMHFSHFKRQKKTGTMQSEQVSRFPDSMRVVATWARSYLNLILINILHYYPDMTVLVRYNTPTTPNITVCP